MKEFIGVIGTITGAFVGGSITWFLSSRQREHDLNKEKRTTLITKYEELHNHLSEVNNFVNILSMKLLAEASKGLELDSKTFKREMPTQKISMLIDFYVEELKEDNEYLTKQLQSVFEIVGTNVLEPNKDKKSIQESAVMIIELSKIITKTIETMKSKLAIIVSNLLKNA